jgi:hypothetical protein
MKEKDRMKFGRYHFLTTVCLACTLAVGLLGCGGSSSLGPGTNNYGNYRVFNGLLVSNNPTGAAINVALRTPTSTPVITSLAEGTLSPASGYLQTTVGNGVNFYAFEPSASTPTVSGSFDVQANTYYSVFVTGIYVPTTNTVTAGEVVRLTDTTPTSQLQTSAGLPTTNAAIRIFNGAPDTPTIYVSNDTSGTPADVPGFDAITYATASGNQTTTGLTGGYLVLPGGTAYTFTVRSGSSTGQALLSIPNFTPAAGTAYTIVITGSNSSADGVPMSYKILTDPLH